jgi:hypothetical protein
MRKHSMQSPNGLPSRSSACGLIYRAPARFNTAIRLDRQVSNMRFRELVLPFVSRCTSRWESSAAFEFKNLFLLGGGAVLNFVVLAVLFRARHRLGIGAPRSAQCVSFATNSCAALPQDGDLVRAIRLSSAIRTSACVGSLASMIWR